MIIHCCVEKGRIEKDVLLYWKRDAAAGSVPCENVSVKYEYEKTSHASVKAWLVFQNQIFIYVERQRSGACAGNKAVAQSSPLDASIGALVRTHVR